MRYRTYDMLRDNNFSFHVASCQKTVGFGSNSRPNASDDVVMVGWLAFSNATGYNKK